MGIKTIKDFYKWLFDSRSKVENDLASNLTIPFIFIFIFYTFNLLSFDPFLTGFLLSIPLLIIMVLVSRVIETVFRKLLGEKNKKIGIGYTYIFMVLIGYFSSKLF